MATKPIMLPEWDETDVNSVEADATHKAQGWLAPGGIPEKPPFQTFNWWMQLVYRWIAFFNGAINNTGAKNLIINPRKDIQQRGLTGGKIQVIEASMNIGGEYTLSFTGAATATIYEFPALLADYPTTIADGSTNVLASAVATDETITATPGYYIAVSFSTTDFDNIQLEKGNAVTSLEIRHNELELCEKTYFTHTNPSGVHANPRFNSTTNLLRGANFEFPVTMRSLPIISNIVGNAGFTATPTVSASDINGVSFSGTALTAVSGTNITNFDADAEIFNTSATYKEDRWFL